MSKTLAEIKQTLTAHLPQLRMRYHILSLGVFGSYLRGEQTRDSDLDLLVEFSQPPSLFGLVELEEQLAELLGVRVDLVLKSALKPRIGKRILEEVVTL